MNKTALGIWKMGNLEKKEASRWVLDCGEPKILLLCLSLLALQARAERTLAERFQNLPSSARGPDAILRIDSLDTDTALTRMAELSGMGFGGVLLILSTADDTTWDKLAQLADRAGDLRMEMGIQDFLLATNETTQADGILDVFDETAVSRHTNKMLSMLQARLGNHYGSTLAWFLTRSFPNASPSRPPDLGALFLDRTGLDLTPYLPALEGKELDGIVSAAYVKEHVAYVTADAWRKRFAEPMRDLIQEAGLDAGIMASEFPLPPEEAATYFKRPVLLGCPTSATARATNKRITQGAHNALRRNIMGHLPLERVQTLPVPTQFACKHEMDRLFIDGATRLLLDPGATAWQDEALFTDAAIACLYARRWQFIFQQSAPLDASGISWQANATQVEMLAIGRTTSREHIYCLVNNSPNGGSITGVFPEKISAAPPEYWSPENGEIIPLASFTQVGDAQTSVRLFIEPYGAFFVVFKKAAE